MTYSCTDLADTILDALKIELPRDKYDDPQAQADICLGEIGRLQISDEIAKELAAFTVGGKPGLDLKDDGAVERIAALIERAADNFKGEPVSWFVEFSYCTRAGKPASWSGTVEAYDGTEALRIGEARLKKRSPNASKLSGRATRGAS